MGYKPKIILTYDDASTYTVEAGNSGYLYAYTPWIGVYSEANWTSQYNTLQGQANANTVTNDDYIYVGQEFLHRQGWTHTHDDYGIYRGGVELDLISAPSGTLISAVLHLFGSDFALDHSFNLTVVDGADLANPLVVADYGDLLNDTTSYGTLASGSYLNEAWNTITLNATGLAVVQGKIGSTLRFGFRSDNDISVTNVNPYPCNDADEGEYLAFYGSNADSSMFIPKIFII